MVEQKKLDAIIQRLTQDQEFRFQLNQTKRYFEKGVCPNCRKRSVFISYRNPYQLKCNHENKCGWQQTTFERYRDSLGDSSDIAPPTEEDPNATAKFFLNNRGFDIAKLSGWYEQHRPRFLVDSNTQQYLYASTVRFYLDAERTRWWERLLDNTAIRRLNKKAHFGGKRKADGSLYRNDGWTPPGQQINPKDTVFIVEGIFHAIAFYLTGKKAIAAFSCKNLPNELINQHKQDQIHWVLAYDDDKAGRNAALKYYQQLKQQKQSVCIALTGNEDLDWDDCYQRQKLTDDFIEDCISRGNIFKAKTPEERAYYCYLQKPIKHRVFEFNNKVYSAKVSDKLNEELEEGDIAIDSREGRSKFYGNVNLREISNCYPEFLYIEQNALTQEQKYFFLVKHAKQNAPQKVPLDGQSLESPSSFNKALLARTAGGTFDGAHYELKKLRDQWFSRQVHYVRTVDYIGYDRESGIYIFDQFGFYQGQLLRYNEFDFITANQHKLKTNVKNYQVKLQPQFEPSWFNDFVTCFDLNGVAALAFWFGTLFAEQIRAEFESWPFLELTGEHGAGKSTLLEFLWRLVGIENYEGFDPVKATPASRARNFMRVSNLPVVLIEGDRENDKAKQRSFDLEELKTAFNGRGIRAIGVKTQGSETIEPPFRAAVVIAQNAQVDGTKALLSRIVYLHCTKEHHTPETRQIATNLHRMGSDELAGFLFQALLKERGILQAFRQAYPEYSERLSQAKQIQEYRVIQVHAKVLAAAKALQQVIPQLDNALLERLYQHLYKRAVYQDQRLGGDHPTVELFWELYDLLNEAEEQQPGMVGPNIVTRQRLNHSLDSRVIAINLNEFNQLCQTARVETITTRELKAVLPNSQRHQFIKQAAIKSAITGKGKWCWLFSKGAQ
ncbi:toprim domain-containing protein [Spartinivicinus ruber]|uniref:toprim domain-containing protein n=1 Tax=Spartinivicinus ruber TaxID=2683272 RepID=UPI0013D3BD29|nr:toprim domain-containing protein [Spartinivicinus ruber]